MRGGAALLATAAVALLAGCNAEEPTGFAGAAGAGEGGALAWAIAERPTELDPLFADRESERLVSRQIHEPLVEDLIAPFDDPRRLNGLARGVVGVRGDTVWLVRLRPGVRFQDGTPLTSQAVLANVERWLAFPDQSGLALGTLADGPRPDLVRFRLPVPDSDSLRSSPSRSSGLSLRQCSSARVGRRARAVPARSSSASAPATGCCWLATATGGGPRRASARPSTSSSSSSSRPRTSGSSCSATAPRSRERARPRSARRLAADPLLTTVEGSGIGIERSVRGIPPDQPAPSLNGLWRTSIGED